MEKNYKKSRTDQLLIKKCIVVRLNPALENIKVDGLKERDYDTIPPTTQPTTTTSLVLNISFSI